MQSSWGSLVLIVIFIAVMWFLMIRPQKKQQQKHRDMVSKLKKGDHVVTIGRLHGIIQNIDNDKNIVTLDCDGIYLNFDMNAIANVKQQSANSVKASENNNDSKSNVSDTKEAKAANGKNKQQDSSNK